MMMTIQKKKKKARKSAQLYSIGNAKERCNGEGQGFGVMVDRLSQLSQLNPPLVGLSFSDFLFVVFLSFWPLFFWPFEPSKENWPKRKKEREVRKLDRNAQRKS